MPFTNEENWLVLSALHHRIVQLSKEQVRGESQGLINHLNRMYTQLLNELRQREAE